MESDDIGQYLLYGLTSQYRISVRWLLCLTLRLYDTRALLGHGQRFL
jgi:hypothetical protein